jgi:ArsR family transcriptional regulator
MRQSDRLVLDSIRTTGYTNIAGPRAQMKDAADFFKVLADEARLKILWLLFNHRELCVCDIMAVLGITQSKASRHLSNLRHAGLVTGRKDGLWSYYALRKVDDELVRQNLEMLRRALAKRPGAPPLLAKLHHWIDSKNRGVVCTQQCACAPPTRKLPTRPNKAPLRGSVR